MRHQTQRGDKRMSDNKPPMTVWLNHGDAEHEPPWYELDHESITWSEQPTGRDFGPYVHMKQFMEEVEHRVCRRKTPPSLSTHEAIALALYELSKEIEEGKV
jgi:hypothetical protein